MYAIYLIKYQLRWLLNIVLTIKTLKRETNLICKSMQDLSC